ncbi:MAG: hypothetical protein QM811_16645 [Pirellulales bacterium]
MGSNPTPALCFYVPFHLEHKTMFHKIPVERQPEVRDLFRKNRLATIESGCAKLRLDLHKKFIDLEQLDLLKQVNDAFVAAMTAANETKAALWGVLGEIVPDTKEGQWSIDIENMIVRKGIDFGSGDIIEKLTKFFDNLEIPLPPNRPSLNCRVTPAAHARAVGREIDDANHDLAGVLATGVRGTRSDAQGAAGRGEAASPSRDWSGERRGWSYRVWCQEARVVLGIDRPKRRRRRRRDQPGQTHFL